MTSCIYLLVFVSYFRYNRLSRQSRIQEVVEDDRTPFWCILTISRGDPHWIIYCILCWTVIFLEKLLHTCIYCKTKLIDENKNAKWNFDELQILSQYIQTKISHGDGSRGDKVVRFPKPIRYSLFWIYNVHVWKEIFLFGWKQFALDIKFEWIEFTPQYDDKHSSKLHVALALDIYFTFRYRLLVRRLAPPTRDPCSNVDIYLWRHASMIPDIFILDIPGCLLWFSF